MFESPGIGVPVLGLVENMAWFTPAELPENKYYIFGKEGAKQLAEEKGLRLLGQIPVVQSICDSGDAGKPVALNADSIYKKPPRRIFPPAQCILFRLLPSYTDVLPHNRTFSVWKVRKYPHPPVLLSVWFFSVRMTLLLLR